jgi:hypothetical protein
MTLPQRADKWRRDRHPGGTNIRLSTPPSAPLAFKRITITDAQIEAAIEPDELPAPVVFDRIWTWSTRLPERKGHRCRVIVAGRMQSALIEFEDGYRVVASVRGLRRVKGE